MQRRPRDRRALQVSPRASSRCPEMRQRYALKRHGCSFEMSAKTSEGAVGMFTEIGKWLHMRLRRTAAHCGLSSFPAFTAKKIPIDEILPAPRAYSYNPCGGTCSPALPQDSGRIQRGAPTAPSYPSTLPLSSPSPLPPTVVLNVLLLAVAIPLWRGASRAGSEPFRDLACTRASSGTSSGISHPCCDAGMHSHSVNILQKARRTFRRSVSRAGIRAEAGSSLRRGPASAAGKSSRTRASSDVGQRYVGPAWASR